MDIIHNTANIDSDSKIVDFNAKTVAWSLRQAKMPIAPLVKGFCRLMTIPLLLGVSSTAHAVTDCAAVTEIPVAECHALVALYDSTAGPIWQSRTNWKVTNEPCRWSGVSCRNGHVTSIKLYDNKLTGTLPNLNALSNLKTLWLFSNELSGAIPDMSGLSSLEELYLNNNQLTGITSLKGLTSLKYFRGERNKLTGPIPDMSDLGSLEELELYDNELSSLTNFKGLVSLEHLKLYKNALAGPIPSLDALTSVTQISLYENQLSGPIPSLDNLAKLLSLRLNDNQLTGPIPDLTNVVKLWILHLQNNQLCGDITPSLVIPSKLDSVNLDQNRLTASDPVVNMFLDDKNPSWKTTQDTSGSCPTATPVEIATPVDTGTEPVDTGTPSTGSIVVAPSTEVIAPNQEPIATFTVTPNAGEAPLKVNFDATGSSDADGKVIQYQWISSDGQKTLGPTTSLTFNTAGTHSITLTVTDNDRATAIVEQTIVVTTPSEPDRLIPRFTATPTQGKAPLAVILDASASSPMEAISQYNWSSSDGQLSSGLTGNFSFNKPGIYVLTLTVTGTDGTNRTTQQTVIVQSPPVARFMAIPNIVKPSSPEVQLDASASFDTDGKIVDYNWTVSDGRIVQGEKPTINFDKEGSYQISLVVNDDDGLSSNNLATQMITVVPDIEKLSPVAIIDINDKKAVSQRTVQLSAKRSADADGNIEKYEWTISDGQTITGDVIKLTFSEDGEYFVTLTVTDNDGLSGVESRTLSVGERVLVEFSALKDFYDVGDLIIVELIENVTVKSRFDLVNLWVAIQLPTGDLLFRTPLPLVPFSINPQPFKENLQSMEAAHRLMDFELIPGIGGTYTFYAAYFEADKNPLEYLDNLGAILRSNLAIQSTTLASE